MWTTTLTPMVVLATRTGRRRRGTRPFSKGVTVLKSVVLVDRVGCSRYGADQECWLEIEIPPVCGWLCTNLPFNQLQFLNVQLESREVERLSDSLFSY